MQRLLLFLFLNACNALTGIDDYSTGSRDGGGGNDAGSSDGGGGNDAGAPDTGPNCNNTLLCSATGTCGQTCGSCDAGPIECWACPSSTPKGRCTSATDPNGCLQDTTYSHCNCKVVGDCPGNTTQTCAVRAGANRECKTCGEPGTDGLPCKNAMTCDASAHTCN